MDIDCYRTKGSVRWENLGSYLAPAQTRAQWDSFGPVKHFSTFRLGASNHKKLKARIKSLDWSDLTHQGAALFDSLGFPYDSSTLAVGPLSRIFQRELETALSFAFAGPLVLHLENRCCAAEVCPLHVFYACLIHLIITTYLLKT